MYFPFVDECALFWRAFHTVVLFTPVAAIECLAGRWPTLKHLLQETHATPLLPVQSHSSSIQPYLNYLLKSSSAASACSSFVLLYRHLPPHLFFLFSKCWNKWTSLSLVLFVLQRFPLATSIRGSSREDLRWADKAFRCEHLVIMTNGMYSATHRLYKILINWLVIQKVWPHTFRGT